MTVQISSDGRKVKVCVDGDIYEEHAECLKDMTFSYARRGIKKLDIQLCSTYYISSKGQQCLRFMQARLGRQGVQVSINPTI